MQLATLVADTQHRVAAALGVDEAQREQTVVAMLENNRRRAPGYWIQLFLAMGIATLGLVLNSTAVVIGAMLVSPLMGPILELGMGFAVGSPFLVLRASLRIVLSIAGVVTCAWLLTLALPFHEVTSEIAARSAPTALDLIVAVFCALTAAYTTVRATSDTTSAAAGTAIGIALVPPLCTCGFGIGIGSWTIAGGAALLFTANLSAILLFAVASFLLLGYNQVDAERIGEAFNGTDTTRTGRLASGAELIMHRAFGSRYGPAVRIMIPAIFLGAVFVPLRKALTEVTWEVKARDGIRAILGSDAPNAVQTVLSLERRNITLHLLVVGSNERAASLEQTLRRRIESRTGVVPAVSVTAVPDAKTLAGLAVSRNNAIATSPSAQTEVENIRQRVQSALESTWPAQEAGALLDWEFSIQTGVMPQVVVRHIGQPLGSPGASLLSRAISGDLGANVEIVDAPLATGIATRPLGQESEWLVDAQPILAWVEQARGVSVCVSAPVGHTHRQTPAQRRLLSTIQASAGRVGSRLTMKDSAGWSIRVVTQRCVTDRVVADTV